MGPDFVRAVPLFATLEDSELERVAGLLQVAEFNEGENIVTEGNVGERFYMLIEGEAFAFREDTGGPAAPPMRYRRGGYFGEVALMTERPRGATVRAAGPVRAAFLGQVDFKTLPDRTRAALEDRLVIYDPTKGLSVNIENNPPGAEGLTRVTISTVAVDFDQGALLAQIIAETASFNLRLIDANVFTERETGKVRDTFDILTEEGTMVPEHQLDALRTEIVELLNPRTTSRSSMPAIFGRLPSALAIAEAGGAQAAALPALMERMAKVADIIANAEGAEGEKLESSATAARQSLAAAQMAVAELETAQSQLEDARSAGASQDELAALAAQLDAAKLKLAAQQTANEEAAAVLERLVKEVEVSKIVAKAVEKEAPKPLELEQPVIEEKAEAKEPSSGAMGSGYEVLLQAFNWESWRQPYYDNLRGSLDELVGQGFTSLWMPPPSQSVSSQGYLPGDLYNLNSEYGSEQSLRDCLNAVRDRGLVPLADVVVNHRCAQIQDAQGRWNTYGGRMNWGPWAITEDSTAYGGTGKRKKEENFTAAPNIDHSNETVQRDISEWLNYLRSDVGFEGWRFDFVKGYPGKFTGDYIQATNPPPKMCVGEFWDTCAYSGGVLDYEQDAHRQRTVDWIDCTGGRSAAFDFTTKAVLQEAVARKEYWRLVDPAGRPPGVLGLWPSRAVTFIDNHDTGSTLNHWPFPDHGLAQGYAYILTHPGTPTVFTDHLYDGNLRSGILSLVALRKELRINSRSTVQILQADAEVYAAIIDGGACVLKIGPGSFDPHADERCAEAARAWDRRFEGDQWCVWTQK